mmetsp:Transcript_19765/g.24408  ORF Transcript_19765/g.24408 Transcript_19765/m.24408 type:complete len:112 (+) Transcript_19765:49-384(+)
MRNQRRSGSALSSAGMSSSPSHMQMVQSLSRQETPLQLSSLQSRMQEFGTNQTSYQQYLQVPLKKIPYKQAMGAYKKSIQQQERERQQEIQMLRSNSIQYIRAASQQILLN